MQLHRTKIHYVSLVNDIYIETCKSSAWTLLHKEVMYKIQIHSGLSVLYNLRNVHLKLFIRN